MPHLYCCQHWLLRIFRGSRNTLGKKVVLNASNIIDLMNTNIIHINIYIYSGVFSSIFWEGLKFLIKSYTFFKYFN